MTIFQDECGETHIDCLQKDGNINEGYYTNLLNQFNKIESFHQDNGRVHTYVVAMGKISELGKLILTHRILRNYLSVPFTCFQTCRNDWVQRDVALTMKPYLKQPPISMTTIYLIIWQVRKNLGIAGRSMELHLHIYRNGREIGHFTGVEFFYSTHEYGSAFSNMIRYKCY